MYSTFRQTSKFIRLTYTVIILFKILFNKILRYYDQLCVMDSKLPISPTQNPISFKWKDAFDKGSFFFSRASLSNLNLK